MKANRGTDLYTVNRAMQDGLMSSMRTAIPGIIQSFDPKTQTAVIQPAIRKRVYSGEQGEIIQEQEPLLLDVPVMFLGGGVSALTFPVAEGDECLVIFADSNIDAWYQSGGVQNQVYPRSHNVADGFAIVGFRSKPKAMGEVAGDMPVIDNLRVSGKLYAQIEGRIDRATDADNADKLGGFPASDYAFDSDVEALGTSLTDSMNDGFSSLTNWANNTFSVLGHDHEWSEIQSKPSVFPPSLHGHPWSAITEKPDTYPATPHGHPWSAISDKPTIYPTNWASVENKPSIYSTNWDNVADKPSTFPPSTHNHTKAQITDFPTSMPASDVYAWAKAATKPSYTHTEVGAAASSHSHSYANSQGRVVTDYNHANFRVPGMYGESGAATNTPGGSYKALIVAANSDTGLQITGGHTSDNLWFRGWSSSGGTYATWRTVLHSGNYNSYAPTKTGGGASGTWGINITGTAKGLSGAQFTQSAGTSTSWGVTNGVNTGAFNAIMGTSSGATWLISGTSNGVFRGGIQLLDSGNTWQIRNSNGTYYTLSGGTSTIMTSSNYGSWAQKIITRGTAAPSGGSNGDFYVKYV